MCARYFMELSPELRPIIEEASRSSLTKNIVKGLRKKLVTEGEVRPTDLAPVIAPNKSGKQAVFPMSWGFHLPQSKLPLINARLETAPKKPTFQESWERRRCIIPASYYFEWEHFLNPATGKKKTGDKYLIQTSGSEVTWLAGLYRIETIKGLSVPVFTVLTREPDDNIRFIHDRMPVILPGAAIHDWIRPDRNPAEVLQEYKGSTQVVYEKAP